MNIFLIGGRGRMGREIKNNLGNFDKIVYEVDIDDKLPRKNVKADIIIDFSTAKDRREYFEYAKKFNIPYACFSTGLSEDDERGLEELSKSVKVLKCSNASRGINLLYKLVEIAGGEMGDSDVIVREIHHTRKKDSPSGTAKEIVKILNDEGISPDIACHRAGNERGFHEVKFFLGDEVLTLSHHALSPSIFARGALERARILISQ